MASYRRRECKRDSQEAEVTLYRDVNDGSWSVGRRPDPQLDPIPMASFASLEAARKWADAQFPGGSWQPTDGRYKT